MALNVNALLRDYKSAGVYTIEVDNTVRTIDESQSLRLLVGFNSKGPFNRPVYLESDLDRQRIFGEIDTRLEHKGCYFNRMAQTMLQEAPIFALNLLNVDNNLSSKDKVNIAAMSLASSSPNPKIWQTGSVSDQSYMKQFGEYDYLKEVDEKLYTFEPNETAIPYVGAVNFAELYDRSKFWIPSAENLTVSSAYAQGNNTSELYSSNFLNFGNIGTEEFSILVFKPENLKGFDITAAEWYGGKENIPYGFIRPYDYISDYFLQVICVKGNWTNYPDLHTDPIWGTYFDELGIIKNKINSFLAAEGIQLLGSWTGIIIPDFVDKQGVPQNIVDKINKNSETTGLLASFNLDAAIALNYDYNGPDTEEGEAGDGCWFLDINADGAYETSEGESAVVPYIVDMVGHSMQGKQYKGENEVLSLAADSSSIIVGGIPNNNLQFTDSSAPSFAYISIGDNNYKLSSNNTEDNNLNGFVWQGTNDASTEYIKFNGNNIFKVYKSIGKSFSELGLAKLNDTSIAGEGNPEWYKSQFLHNTVIPLGFSYISGMNLEGTKWAVPCYKNPADGGGSPKTSWWIVTLEKKSSNIKVTSKWNNMQIAGLSTSGYTIKDFIDRNSYWEVSNNFGTGVVSNNGIVLSQNLEYSEYCRYYFNQQANCIYEFNTIMTPVFGSGLTIVDEDSGVPSSHGDLHLLGDSGNARPTLDGDDTEYQGGYQEVNREITGYTIDYSPMAGGRIIKSSENNYYNCSFLSYNYITEDLEAGAPVFGDFNARHAVAKIENVRYFNDPSVGYLDNGNNSTSDPSLYQTPANKTTFSVFICTNEQDAQELLVGDYVNNLTMGTFDGQPANVRDKDNYKIIPGVTKVTSKLFVNVEPDMTYTYKGKKYKGYNLDLIQTSTGARGEYTRRGFYVYTTTEAVAINEENFLTRQLPLSDQAISKCLRFIPMKGLKISTRHKPGYDMDGRMNIEGGIEKIYSMLADKGVERGLCNPEMLDYRYIVDSMSHGISQELGGKRYLSELAKKRGKTTAILNLPSKKEFTASVNPYFNDSYTLGINVKPAFDTKYIPQGGNMELYSTSVFTLPDEESGSKFTACFWPNLTYQVNGKTISMPPAADVANTFIRKYNGGNPYVINANLNGLIQNPYVVGLEYDADNTDRDYLEPFGVNTIIRKGGQIMIYGNRTAYQKVKSDLNYLHVREILNTIEINCERVLYRYNFAYNTAVLRAAVVTALTPILQEVQEAGAIDSYTIICDETNNTPEVIAEAMGIVDINVWFNMGMEKIIQRITINRSFTTNNE